jgi:hypothetical protein
MLDATANEGLSSELMDSIADGKQSICASKWPIFMYDLFKGYDPKHKEIGLCHGIILVRVCDLSSFHS